MDERSDICKRCGGDVEHGGLETGGDLYCSKFCMLVDNPDVVKRSKNAQEWLKGARKREAIKVKMRALKKEAMEVGIPWDI